MLLQAFSGAGASCTQLSEVVKGTQQSVYMPDEASLSKAGAYSWTMLPQSTKSLLLQGLRPLPDVEAAETLHIGRTLEKAGDMADICRQSAGVLMLWSDRPRALSQRERLWAAALAAKLQSVFINQIAIVK